MQIETDSRGVAIDQKALQVERIRAGKETRRAQEWRDGLERAVAFRGGANTVCQFNEAQLRVTRLLRYEYELFLMQS